MELFNFDNLKYFFTLVLYVLLIIGPLLIAVAFLTYLERKVIALVQYRKGPNVVGFFGLLQPFADGVKLFSKETIIPASSSKIIFILAPMISFSLSLIAWSVIPISENIVLSGNILSNKNVLASMKLAYEKNHDVELVERLYLSLLEGANAGGDRRGLFSASIIVVNENKPPISLRVDYSKKPLKKLKKIIDKTNEKSYANWLKFLPVISNPYNSEENKKS